MKAFCPPPPRRHGTGDRPAETASKRGTRTKAEAEAEREARMVAELERKGYKVTKE